MTAMAGGYEMVPPEQIHFDWHNPRLAEYGVGAQTSQEELLEKLYKVMAVDEVAMSIAANGFWAHEPLLVAEENGLLVAIEGNRRLAAVRLLLDANLREQLRATDLPVLDGTAAERLRRLPVIRTTRDQCWQYLAFKHVNGPLEWGSYAKAQYVARVHNDFGVPLDEIGRQIGDKHRSVQRLYRAMMVLEQAEQARVFSRTEQVRGRLFFNHLETALGYTGYQDFLQLEPSAAEAKEPVPASHVRNLGEVLCWLYGDTRDNKPAVVQSQNPDLRRLDQVLRDPAAVEALRSGMPLAVAVDISRGDPRIFRDSIQDAAQALRKALATAPTGYRGERELLDQAYDIAETLSALVDLMERSIGRTKPTIPARRSLEGESNADARDV